MQILAQSNSPFAESLYSRTQQYLGERKSGKYANGIFYAKGIVLVIVYVAAYLYFIFFAANFSEMLFACLVFGPLPCFYSCESFS